jgi:hypothetical protein
MNFLTEKMDTLKNTLTDNALTRYYELRIKYLEGEKERLQNESRADYLITLDFWIYAQRMVSNYIWMHKESNHDIYIEQITNMMDAMQLHEETNEDTAINRLRNNFITHCKESIEKCNKYTAAR